MNVLILSLQNNVFPFQGIQSLVDTLCTVLCVSDDDDDYDDDDHDGISTGTVSENVVEVKH
ncbi:unnamed protein product [Ceratitis capitata]|uniref:(Mediterranean fruit fly) hypothetical protein n=1 Tax=Ceratitis capitata TaxID=7213 RepID=A0A811URY5_CERCA|nr:unnamed protein product [Ceratitis capitata]